MTLDKGLEVLCFVRVPTGGDEHLWRGGVTQKLLDQLQTDAPVATSYQYGSWRYRGHDGEWCHTCQPFRKKLTQVVGVVGVQVADQVRKRHQQRHAIKNPGKCTV